MDLQEEGPQQQLLVSGPTVELIGPQLKGVDKWLGGELASDGCIYGVPGTAKNVLKIDPSTDEVTVTGADVCLHAESAVKRGRFKWLRGARCPTGEMFAIPSNADRVLKIDNKGTCTAIGPKFKGHWKWHGGIIANNGCLYGCPCNSDYVLKINPVTSHVTEVAGPWEGQNKWYGALKGSDGCMYCIPNCASSVLKFDPETETGELLGELPEGNWKWHGGTVGGDGNIYGVPAHGTKVLQIVVATGEVHTIGPDLPKTKYKWGGACCGAHGDVYCFPSDTERVLKINVQPGVPNDSRVTLIGPEFEGKNKWQNGFLGRDNAVYGLPCNASGVLRISEDDQVTMIGGPWEGVEKWEGGVMADNGIIYAMPQQSEFVLKIDPGPPAPTSGTRELMASENGIDEPLLV